MNQGVVLAGLLATFIGCAVGDYFNYDDLKAYRDLYKDQYISDPYQDILMQDLYQRLSNLDQPGYPAYDDELPLYDDEKPNEISLTSRESGQTDIRDPELASHSSTGDGFKYMSGGAGEGLQHLMPAGQMDNVQEVKSDEALPFYCHPPNPCPKGYTAKDGCHEFVEDTADFQKDWINTMMQKGMCACDEDHMFHCPQTSQDLYPGSVDQGTFNELTNNVENGVDLNSYLDELLQAGGEKSPFLKGNKRAYLVAKKSPRIKRHADVIDQMLEQMQKEKKENPYLTGDQVKTMAKKGLGYN